MQILRLIVVFWYLKKKKKFQQRNHDDMEYQIIKAETIVNLMKYVAHIHSGKILRNYFCNTSRIIRAEVHNWYL